MDLHPVTSDSLRAVGYDPTTRTLRIAFLNGGIYDYEDVDPALYQGLLRPHPWRRLGLIVKSHRYRRVSAA